MTISKCPEVQHVFLKQHFIELISDLTAFDTGPLKKIKYVNILYFCISFIYLISSSPLLCTAQLTSQYLREASST